MASSILYVLRKECVYVCECVQKIEGNYERSGDGGKDFWLMGNNKQKEMGGA